MCQNNTATTGRQVSGIRVEVLQPFNRAVFVLGRESIRNCVYQRPACQRF